MLEGLEGGKITLKLAPGFTTRAFFELVLQNTMEGFFADPLYGGNKDMAALENDRLSRRALRLSRLCRQA